MSLGAIGLIVLLNLSPYGPPDLGSGATWQYQGPLALTLRLLEVSPGEAGTALSVEVSPHGATFVLRAELAADRRSLSFTGELPSGGQGEPRRIVLPELKPGARLQVAEEGGVTVEEVRPSPTSTPAGEFPNALRVSLAQDEGPEIALLLAPGTGLLAIETEGERKLELARFAAEGAAGALPAAVPPPRKAAQPREADMRPFWSPAEPLSATYVIDVTIDPEQETISGTETITLVNPSSRPIEQLAIRKGLIRAGTFTVEIDGERPSLAPSPEQADADTPILVALPKPLAADETAELHIEFRGPLPDLWEGLMALQEWHPRLWWGHPTHDDFEVSIHAPEGWALAATGRADSPRGPWRAKGVRSFGIVLDKDLQVEQARAGDMLIRCLFTPERRECAKALLDGAVAAADYYRSEFGFYPQPFLSIIPGPDRWMGGYPFATGIVAVHGQSRFGEGSDEWWRWIMSHEIGHQYWSEHVLDPDHPDWLWIGLGIYMDQQYVRARGLHNSRRDFGSLSEAIEHGTDTTIERPPEQLAHIDFDYNGIVRHSKGYAVISALETVLGRDEFRRIHDHCLANYKGKCLGAREFQRVCEEQTGQDLSWFFDQWLRSRRYLGYRVASVDKKQEGDRHVTTVQVERFGTLEMPIPVEARFEDGSTQRATTERLLQVSALRFESDAPLQEVVLDPDGALPLFQAPLSELKAAIAKLPWTGAGEKAKQVYERARTGEVEDPDLWVKLGLMLYDGRFYEEALDAFAKAAESEGYDRTIGLVWQGHVLDLLGRRQEALEYYRQALPYELPSPITHSQYGIVIDGQWIEDRLETPFARIDAK